MLERRAAWRGHRARGDAPIGLGDAVEPGRTTCSTSAAARIASRRWSRPTSPRKGAALREAVDGGAAVLAVCGGYQLLGRFYRDRAGAELPGRRPLPAATRSPASGG